MTHEITTTPTDLTRQQAGGLNGASQPPRDLAVTPGTAMTDLARATGPATGMTVHTSELRVTDTAKTAASTGQTGRTLDITTGDPPVTQPVRDIQASTDPAASSDPQGDATQKSTADVTRDEPPPPATGGGGRRGGGPPRFPPPAVPSGVPNPGEPGEPDPAGRDTPGESTSDDVVTETRVTEVPETLRGLKIQGSGTTEIVVNTAHPNFDEAEVDRLLAELHQGIPTSWESMPTHEELDEPDKQLYRDSETTPKYFAKVTHVLSPEALEARIRAVDEIPEANVVDITSIKERIRTENSLTTETRLTPQIARIVRSEEAQEIAQAHGFSEITYVQPVAVIFDSQTRTKISVYPWQPGYMVPGADTEAPIIPGSEQEDVFNAMTDLDGLLTRNYISPGDLSIHQFLITRQANERSLHLTDAERFMQALSPEERRALVETYMIHFPDLSGKEIALRLGFARRRTISDDMREVRQARGEAVEQRRTLGEQHALLVQIQQAILVDPTRNRRELAGELRISYQYLSNLEQRLNTPSAPPGRRPELPTMPLPDGREMSLPQIRSHITELVAEHGITTVLQVLRQFLLEDTRGVVGPTILAPLVYASERYAQDFAELLERHKSTLSRLLNGENLPNVNVVRDLLERLRVPEATRETILTLYREERRGGQSGKRRRRPWQQPSS